MHTIEKENKTLSVYTNHLVTHYTWHFWVEYTLPFNRGLCTCILCRWRFIGTNSSVFSPLLQLDLKEDPGKQKFKESLS